MIVKLVLKPAIFTALLLVVTVLGTGVVRGQADDVCREFGMTPSRDLGDRNRLARFIYGKINVVGLAPDEKRPQVTVIFSESAQPGRRLILGDSGNYCFQRGGAGGMISIEVEGIEVGRKSLSDISGQQRERQDFDIYPPRKATAAPGIVSAKFFRPPNPKTTDLYKKVASAELNKKTDKAIEFAQEIVDIDPDDFIAWAKLGSLDLGSKKNAEAEAAFRKALAIRADYTPALLNLGILRALDKKFPEAIEIFNQAVTSDPTSASAYRLLGEAYLQNRQGSLGLAALDKALEIDPIGMAECHLLKARLFDLAGAKNLASHEYKAFLEKVPDYPDKKSLEKYIKDNPE